MERVHSHAGFQLVCAFLGAALLSSCAGAINTGSPTSANSAAGSALSLDALHANALAGEYSGSINDTKFGTGKVKATFTQAQNSVGGLVTATYAKSTVAYTFASTLSGYGVNGWAVATISNKACSFGVTGTYNAARHKLYVSYTGYNSCLNDDGSFSLTKQCYYREGGAPNDVNRLWNASVVPDNGPRQC